MSGQTRELPHAVPTPLGSLQSLRTVNLVESSISRPECTNEPDPMTVLTITVTHRVKHSAVVGYGTKFRFRHGRT